MLFAKVLIPLGLVSFCACSKGASDPVPRRKLPAAVCHGAEPIGKTATLACFESSAECKKSSSDKNLTETSWACSGKSQVWCLESPKGNVCTRFEEECAIVKKNLDMLNEPGTPAPLCIRRDSTFPDDD